MRALLITLLFLPLVFTRSFADEEPAIDFHENTPMEVISEADQIFRGLYHIAHVTENITAVTTPCAPDNDCVYMLFQKDGVPPNERAVLYALIKIGGDGKILIAWGATGNHAPVRYH